MSDSKNSHITLENVSQSFSTHDGHINLFSGISLTISQGQSYALTGPSGSGKSSLLMLMSGLEQPSSGAVSYRYSEQTMEVNAVRESIGFIFQQFHLLPELTALNNVALPLKLRGHKQALAKAKEWLERVGLGHRLNHKPQQLSGGEQQRVAIARALVFEPKFIFADEPTGNLDEQNASEVADMLFACCEAHGAGLVVVTHSQDLANRAKHVFSLKSNGFQQAQSTAQSAIEVL